MDIQKIDKNFLTRMPSGIDLRFYDADEVPFEVYGLLPHQQDEPYRRIPLQVGKESNIGVEYLSASTTGGRIRFRTNSRIVALSAEWPNLTRMNHMPLSGSSGFDPFDGQRHEAGGCGGLGNRKRAEYFDAFPFVSESRPGENRSRATGGGASFNREIFARSTHCILWVVNHPGRMCQYSGKRLSGDCIADAPLRPCQSGFFRKLPRRKDNGALSCVAAHAGVRLRLRPQCAGCRISGSHT